ncbi:cupin domain-containing protein [Olivibacter sp. SDN3]|uniref:cupin domain-containing protein n=1 Tax=Olivibacter sp. SDN3 TaxID=2764720 RepID=UPI001650DE37|nr:cupin domain-containing protein [Olivibacter sp. SDN3]QNL48811.1 cupin domain-containing protein [Olivibacter sp. SDN3]
MKHLKTIALLALVVMLAACENKMQSTNTDTQETENLIFAKGEKINNDNFTGTVWLNNLVNADSVNQSAVGSVTFEPGARTKWHAHPAGQIILALDGVGYYQEERKEKVIVRKGEVVKCPIDVPHWHGASADSAFVQIAITGREKGETVWLNPVTDEEYHK